MPRENGRSVRRASTTTELIFDGGKKYERPVMPRARTLASFRAQYGFRRGAGAKR